MQTRLLPELLATATGQEADRILRSCVHCGFCTATCPTYQLLGDELDGPRGRIYQIKNLLEGEAPTVSVQTHLDRCLTCLNCESSCPSGVKYGRLVDIGREFVEQRVPRATGQRLLRRALRALLPYRWRFEPLLRSGRLMRPLLPAALRRKVPPWRDPGPLPIRQHLRRVLMLDGCVQPALTPATNAAATRVLDRLGIGVERVARAGCCGAVSHHLSAGDEARDFMRRNIDAWWPSIEPAGGYGVEAIVVTASGCGAMVKDYGHLLADDPRYAERAARVAALATDLCELLSAEQLAPLAAKQLPPIAFHPPCTLQHAQKLGGRVEALLSAAGIELTSVRDPHLCCGSAGTYSILQAGLSEQLRERKLDALQQQAPKLIVTANVGCQTHLQEGTSIPVLHWIELFDPEFKHP